MSTHHYKHATPTPSNSTDSLATTTRNIAAGDTAGEKARSSGPVTADDIRLCAYQKWEEAGKPTEDGIRFWLEAEQELRQTESRDVAIKKLAN